MRTLKIFITAASLFLFATPAISSTSTPQMEMPFLFSFTAPTISATAYPPEMPDIQNAKIQFMCETPSSLFLKVYLTETWQVLITGQNKKEMMMEITVKGTRNIFVFLSSTNEWKNAENLNEEEGKAFEKSRDFVPTIEDGDALESCMEFKLRQMLKR